MYWLFPVLFDIVAGSTAEAWEHGPANSQCCNFDVLSSCTIPLSFKLSPLFSITLGHQLMVVLCHIFAGVLAPNSECQDISKHSVDTILNQVPYVYGTLMIWSSLNCGWICANLPTILYLFSLSISDFKPFADKITSFKIAGEISQILALHSEIGNPLILWSFTGSSSHHYNARCSDLALLSQLIQIITNYRNGGTGQLSSLYIFLTNFRSLGRFTTMLLETRDYLRICDFGIKSSLNIVQLLQILYYQRRAPPKTTEKNNNREKKLKSS